MKMKFSALVLIFLMASPSFAGKESHGGDAYALEFIGLGRSIAKALLSGSLALSHIDPQKFNNQVEITRVVTMDSVTFQGAQVDAKNYPDENRIEISRPRWKEYNDDLRRKLTLVLHEYLGVMRAGDYHYEISDKSLTEFQKLSDSVLERLILDALDNTCGDTWCEGDFNYSFDSLECSEAKGCTLYVTLSYRDTNGEEPLSIQTSGEGFTGSILSKEKGTYQDFKASCELPAYSKLEDTSILSLSPNGEYSLSLRDSFYDTLTKCFSKIEDALHPISNP